jgi:SPP1 gp7 family putative phage head morphogenesis protein
VQAATPASLDKAGDKLASDIGNGLRKVASGVDILLQEMVSPEAAAVIPALYLQEVLVDFAPGLAGYYWGAVTQVRDQVGGCGVPPSPEAPMPVSELSASAWALIAQGGEEDAVVPEAEAAPPPLTACDLLASLPDQFMASYMDEARDRLKAIGDRFAENVRATLAEGVGKGEGVAELTKRVQQAVGVTEPYAEMVARTEVAAAANAAALAQVRLFTKEGKKTWLAAHDERTRPTHAEADGQTVRIDEPFDIGGWPMQRPHDPSAPPEETINCRCVLTFDLDDVDLSIDPHMLSPTDLTQHLHELAGSAIGDQFGPPLQYLYAPGQSRDRQGRFGRGGAGGGPTPEGGQPHAGGGLTPEQYSALDPDRHVSEANIEKALNTDQQGRDTLTAIRSFTEKHGGVSHVRDAIDKRASGEPISKELSDRVDAFEGAMNGYPIGKVPQLYRGMAIQPKTKIDDAWFSSFEKKYAAGQTLNINASSFTSSQRIAKEYQGGGGTRRASPNHVEVRMVVDGPMHALPVERLSKFAYEKEWIGGGKFTITKLRVNDTDKRHWFYEMHVKQEASLGQGGMP